MRQTDNKSNQPLVAVIGPTAVGKTDLVLKICEELQAEVVNLDSMQIYRYMDVGTAKPSITERESVRHHLIDIVDPDEEYNVCCYINDADRVCSEIAGRGRLPLLTGGTGLYLRGVENGVFELEENQRQDDSIKKSRISEQIRKKLQEELDENGRDALFEKLEKIDPITAARIHPNDTYRLLRALQIFEQTGIPWSTHLDRQKGEGGDMKRAGQKRKVLKIGLFREREALYERINLRTEKMFEEGLLDEVQSLLERGYGADLKPMQAIGYRHVIKYLSGEWSKEKAVELMARDTRRYAKRQLTWFRKDLAIKWLEPNRKTEVLDMIKKYVDQSI